MLRVVLYIWQIIQNVIGLIILLIHRKDRIKRISQNGIIFWTVKNFFGSGISLGSYIIIDEEHMRYSDRFITETVSHEYGHQRQSLYLGPMYLFTVGIVSFVRNIHCRLYDKNDDWYYDGWPENWADKLGGIDR